MFLMSEVPLYTKANWCVQMAATEQQAKQTGHASSSSAVLLSSLELSDTKVYEP